MSVSIDRFVRVMSGGTVVTDQLVQVRFAKVQQALAAVKAQVKRVTDAGLALNPTFLNQLQGLEQGVAAAMQQPNNQAKCNALEPLKGTLRAIAAQAGPDVDGLLADAATMRQREADALAAANRANQAIQQIPLAPFRAPLEARLAAVPNSGAVAQAAKRQSEVRTAITTLTQCAADANQITTDAAAAVQLLADRTAKLNTIDQRLAGLANTAEVADAKPKGILDRELAALRQRRDALANAGPAQITAEIAGADTLRKDITAFGIKLNYYIQWGKSKVDRTRIAGGCQAYLAEAGNNPALAWLAAEATSVSAALQKVLQQSENDPNGATTALANVQGEFAKLWDKFAKQILEPRLTPKVDQLILNNPDGPEAKMKQALDSPEFTRRLLEVHNTALAFGANTSTVSPGELVAIYTYTTNDYKQMNGTLIGYYTPKTPKEKQQIDIKNEEGKKALEKLPKYTAGITQRGEEPWAGADAQYTKDNVFTTKAFWSTGVGFKFDGLYQIAISGTSGRSVGSFSAYPKESEVLYPPGVRFKVLSRTDTLSGSGVLTRVDVVVQEV